MDTSRGVVLLTDGYQAPWASTFQVAMLIIGRVELNQTQCPTLAGRTIVWPQGTTTETSDGVVSFRLSDGSRVRVGDVIEPNGYGFSDSDHWGIPAGCPGEVLVLRDPPDHVDRVRPD